MNANFLGLGLQLRFTARNMTTFRATMTLNILDGHVDLRAELARKEARRKCEEAKRKREEALEARQGLYGK